MIRSLAIVMLVALAAGGCASEPRLGLECPARPRPRGVVFIVHGVFPDGAWNGWEDELAAGLEREGAVAARLEWRCHMPEYWLASTVDQAAAKIARAAATLEAAHARTGCTTRLAFAGIGYSGGTQVLLDAALDGLHFRKLVYGGSPIFLASGDLGDMLEQGRIDRLVNYHSLVDSVVWPTIPIGIWGYGGRGASRVEDRLTWEVHGVRPFAGERGRVVREVAAEFATDAHRCFDDPAFRATVRDVVAELEGRCD